ncbi:hypothetical protein MPRS_54860 [Mycobacterium paraseoulense]|uniref:Radical SAM core domain-containing protein n=1 Tax=Mycobacterium paraseoulense TaxID=590652 RepID=A0A1X0I8R9_9MYCO|nr:radical SAM protein [Mycobacterium paraseoulense]ORB39246.1 hypothetical protein BST39_15815 [Mycobacterium paraseoulense]BBZ74393.1 hypothetical protein MPRS_54860 [Mycobacterium paraseoulense]
MLRIQSLTILSTLRCNARCAHCVTDSSPERGESLSRSVAEQAAREAAAAGWNVNVSGGEPMIDPGTVELVARAAKPFGVSVAVATNGFWAKSDAVATKRVARLKDAGVDTLLLSLDYFHLPYVSEAQVLAAARAAATLGMRCQVAITRRPGTDNDALAARAGAIAGVAVKIHGVSQVGRAEGLDASAFDFTGHMRPCPVIGQLALTPDGHLYACCAASIRFGHDSPLCGGTYEAGALRRFADQLGALPFFQDIQSAGPLAAALNEMGRTRLFAFAPKARYTDPCSACRDVCRAYTAAETARVEAQT